MATIRKRGTRWFVQLNKRGLRPARTFTTKVQAERWARETEIAIENGTFGAVARASHTVADLVRLYRHEKGYDFSEATDVRLSRAKRIWGDMKINAGQQEIMKRFRASHYAPSSADLALAAVTAAVVYAKNVWQWDVSPEPWRASRRALKASGAVPITRERERRCSRAEEALLAEHWCSEKVTPDIVAFLIDTPVRSGELAALRWADVERHGAGKFIILVRDRKGTRGATDRVPLLGRSAGIMERWWQARGRSLNVMACTQTSLYRAFKRAVIAAGLEDLKLHDLRHEGISRLFERGLHIPQVSVVSGHRSWKNLKRYTHVSAESLFELI